MSFRPIGIAVPESARARAEPEAVADRARLRLPRGVDFVPSRDAPHIRIEAVRAQPAQGGQRQGLRQEEVEPLFVLGDEQGVPGRGDVAAGRRGGHIGALRIEHAEIRHGDQRGIGRAEVMDQEHVGHRVAGGRSGVGLQEV